MNDRKKKRRTLIVLFLVCVVMLAGGIFLATRTEMMGRSPAPGQSWKLVLGTMIASFAGFGLIGVLIYATPPGAMKGMGNPPAALQSGQLTQRRRDAIRKKEIVALVLTVILAAAMLWAWLNPFSLALAACMVVGAAGALVLLSRGKQSLFALAFATGTAISLLIVLTSRPSTDNRRYAYFVNGVKVGEGNGKASGGLMSFVGAIFLFASLILGVAYLITALCAMFTRD